VTNVQPGFYQGQRVDSDSGNVERVFGRVFGNTVRRRSVR